MEVSRDEGKGNPPDCAYYLLLALCVSATFLAFGGIFTYMGYWPDTAFHHAPGAEAPPNGHSSSYYAYGPKQDSVSVYKVVGPLVLGSGLIIAIGILALAMKFDCNHEPEEPRVLINELASNLNLSVVSVAEPKYELVGRDAGTISSIAGPSHATVTVQAV